MVSCGCFSFGNVSRNNAMVKYYVIIMTFIAFNANFYSLHYKWVVRTICMYSIYFIYIYVLNAVSQKSGVVDGRLGLCLRNFSCFFFIIIRHGTHLKRLFSKSFFSELITPFALLKILNDKVS